MALQIRVMLVDDSAVVRGLFDRALREDSSINIVCTAANGEVAIAMLKSNPVDVIVLDIEMPVMDGLTALPELLAIAPKTRIIMSSSLTKRNAEVSVRAMQLGASDYIAKPSTRDVSEVGEFYRTLISKIKALAPHVATISRVDPPKKETPMSQAIAASKNGGQMFEPITTPTAPLRRSDHIHGMTALAIASSTGGPQALLHIFREMKGNAIKIPIFITQHMPANFTTILADHITKASGLDCHEAVDEEEVKPGNVYLAPGDFHMTVTKAANGTIRMKLDQSPPVNFCRPSADPMLKSLSKIYGDRLLVAVLTGLGADGARGASDVVASGGAVIAQDEATCVVYGMPKAVADAKLTSAVFPLNAIAPFFLRAVT
ncbi:MAG: protein-glutamate methylesterase/protein-glutamine glutaminase [Rickettsiales bacterium]